MFSKYAKTYKQVIKDSTYVEKCMNLLPEYSYVFFLPEWEDEALDNRKDVKNYFEMDNDHVIAKPIANDADLTKVWNDMYYVNGLVVRIKSVIINSHARNSRLSYNVSNDKFEASDVIGLDDTFVEYLVLLGCNAGHLDYPDNIATLFSKKNRYKEAIASDGTVYYNKKYYLLGNWIYNPKADESFIEQSSEAGVNRTTCEGFLKIEVNTSSTSVDVIGKKKTLIDLLESY